MNNNFDAMYALYNLFLNANDDTMQRICDATNRNEDELAIMFSELFEDDV